MWEVIYDSDPTNPARETMIRESQGRLTADIRTSKVEHGRDSSVATSASSETPDELNEQL